MLAVFPYALWLMASALQSAIAVRMWARHLYRDYPLFFAYTLSHLLSVPVVLYCYRLGDRDLYRNAYAGLEIVYAVLKFGDLRAFFTCFPAIRWCAGIGFCPLALGQRDPVADCSGCRGFKQRI